AGEHILYYYSLDQAGNQEGIKSALIKVRDDSDTTPSVTALTVEPAQPDNNDWYSEAPQISLSTGDNAAIYYQWDSADQTNFSVPLVPEHLLGGGSASSQMVPGWRLYLGAFAAPQGIHTLYYFSVDTAGNTESIKSRTLKAGSETIVLPSPNTEPGASRSGDSSPVKSALDKIDIRINGLPQTGMAEIITSQIDGRKVTTVALLSPPMLQYLGNASDHLVLGLQLESESEQVRVRFDGELIWNLTKKKGIIEFQQGSAIYTVPAQQIKIEEIDRQFGNPPLQDMKVEIEIARPAEAVLKALEKAAVNGQFTVLVPPQEFNIKCSYINNTVDVRNFSVPVTRAILIPENIDRNRISTGMVMDVDGTLRHVPTKVILVGKQYYARITGFTNSVYVLVNHAREFEDVQHHWAQSSVNEMASRSIINGTGDGQFTPQAAMTRAEFAALMIRALGLSESDRESRFADITKGDWFQGAVTAACEYNLISGYTDGSFQPRRSISREEAVVLIARAMNLMGMDTRMAETDIEKEITKFADGNRFDDWSRQALAYCSKHQLLMGSQGMAEPDRDITRAEAAVLVMKLLQKTELI
ncbi:MAG TPA: S-layer homology domain-containing protein, partial [Syntrophomonas sp.]|nr:S-layer homology domain-containing protein [Syntrophomonas sp.]